MAQTLILRAKHLIPRAGTEIENGAVAFCANRIVAVGGFPRVKRRASGSVRDLSNAVILPGLINAHTHLELTDLQGRIERRDRFVDWLRQIGRFVVAWKLRDRLLFRRHGQFYESAKHGMRECIAAGTTAVADICNSGACFDLLRYGPLRSVVFQEVIDLRARSLRRKVNQVRRRLRARPDTLFLRKGISPHAPYSASLDLYRRSALLAGEMNVPLATHLHETPEEIEALEKGTGDFRKVMEYFMRLRRDWRPPGRPMAVLDGLGVITSRTLLAHCNYLSEFDIAILDDRKPSVVYCPRSHAWFGHEPHPFGKLLDRGINVALGTDSAASCSSLSMLDEMRFLVENRKDVSPRNALAMATTNGARALGLAGRIGLLAPGLEADLAVVGVLGNPPNAHEAILHPSSRNVLTIVRGRTAWETGVME